MKNRHNLTKTKMDYAKIARNMFEEMTNEEIKHFFGDTTPKEERARYAMRTGVGTVDRTDLYNIFNKLMDIVQYEEPSLFLEI